MPTAHCQVEGIKGDVINFSSMNFLGLVGHPRITVRRCHQTQDPAGA